MFQEDCWYDRIISLCIVFQLSENHHILFRYETRKGCTEAIIPFTNTKDTLKELDFDR